jgi:Flp pilus assembly pilin Flp
MLSMINLALQQLFARTVREDGQALAEYGVILALILAVCVVSLGLLGAAILGALDAIIAEL